MEASTQEERPSKLASRAWYGASIPEFLQSQPDAVVGALTTDSEFSILPAQTEAWLAQIRLLKEHLLPHAQHLPLGPTPPGSRYSRASAVRGHVFCGHSDEWNVGCFTAIIGIGGLYESDRSD